ncbi:uncharacterized protein [Littorina saxatilis]|uniref:uncharacterized protein n=1 Tax=Littorina saxatilis TaxID=31220 RepID=UPI0038B42E69
MPTSGKQSSDDEGLGTGPVVAIVIVIVIVVVVVVVIVVIVVRRRNGAEKHNRTSGAAGSTSPGNSNLGGIEGHDNLVYSANRLEMDTIPPMSGHAANPENTPDYYNVLRLNSPGTGPSAPAQNDLYENTRSPPPDEEYAVVNKNGKKKQDPQPDDEYALPNKDQEKKKKKREKQAGQGQQKNNIPTENKTKKGRKTDQQANPPAFNSNAAGRSTQAEEAAAAGTSDDEPVAGDSGMATSRPEQPSDMYNKLGDKERAGMQLDHPQTHYDHISAPYGDYSGMDLEDKIRDQQREAVADQYSHI